MNPANKIMNKHLLTLGILGALLVGPWASGAFAQAGEGEERAGTTSFNELMVPVTPRTVALGQTLTGGLDDLAGVEAVASNPAALSVNAGTEVLFSRMEYIADIGINYMGVAHSFGANNIALTLTAWSYGDIPRTTEAQPEISDATWTGGTTVIGGTFTRQFTDRISAGFTIKGMSQSLDEASSSSLAFDGGITYAIPESGFRFGVALRNFGTATGFSGVRLTSDQAGPGGTNTISGDVETLEGELPSSIAVSGSYTRQFEGDVSLTALASGRSNSYDPNEFGAGLEFGYADIFFIRGGVNFHTESDASAWDVWNVGAGLNIPAGPTNFRVDYAFRPSQYFDGAHLFSVGVGL